MALMRLPIAHLPELTQPGRKRRWMDRFFFSDVMNCPTSPRAAPQAVVSAHSFRSIYCWFREGVYQNGTVSRCPTKGGILVR
jgi:hypothetical protein